MPEDFIPIDIVKDIIKASYTGGRYKGEEVNKLLSNRIDELNSSTLLVIDIQNAQLDYMFCQYAFGPILKSVQENNKPILFKMKQLHKRSFYRGVLKFVDNALPRNTSVEESEKIFLDTTIFTMILTDDKDSIEFIGNLSPEDKSILDLVNNRHLISEREIIDAKQDLEPTIIVESLKSLNSKGFILNPKNGSNNYRSIYEILNSV